MDIRRYSPFLLAVNGFHLIKKLSKEEIIDLAQLRIDLYQEIRQNMYFTVLIISFTINLLIFVVRNKRKYKTVSEWRKHKKKMIMKNEILNLQYQIRRYQSMGNGAMCQALNNKLQKLQDK